MKRSILAVSILIFLIIGSRQSAQAQIPTLKSATVTFLTPTHTNDKDAGTKVFVYLYTSGGEKVATLNTCCRIKFPDNDFSSNPYDMEMVSEVSKRGIQTGFLQVDIATNGLDTWTFVPTLVLNFSDGTTRTLNTLPKRVVDQDAKSTVFTFF